MEKIPKFDIVRDIKTVEAGGFFCQACLVGKDKAVVSPDPRYCQDCFDVLHEAMKTDTRWRHSASMPKLLVDEAKASRHQSYNRVAGATKIEGNCFVVEPTN